MNKQLIKLFYQCEDYFFRSISKECLELNEQAFVYVTGVAVASLNLFVLRENIANLNAVLAEYEEIFTAKQLPWAAVISEYYLETSLEDFLEHIPFKAHENAVAMVLELTNKEKLQPQNNLLIRRMDAHLVDWMPPLLEAFSSTEELTSLYLQTHEKALANNAQFRHYSLYVDDKPVSSLTLSFNQNIARIDDVGTLPLHQKKGYATYLIDYALEEAKKAGVEFCFLEASDSGLSVYQKIGFKSLFKRKYIGNFAYKKEVY